MLDIICFNIGNVHRLLQTIEVVGLGLGLFMSGHLPNPRARCNDDLPLSRFQVFFFQKKMEKSIEV